jgi:phospholipase C
MPFINNNAKRVGNRFYFEEGSSIVVDLFGRGEFREVPLDIFGGKISFSCESLNRANPKTLEQFGSVTNPQSVDIVHREPAKIELFQLIDSQKVSLDKFEYEGGDTKGDNSGDATFTHDTGALTDFPSKYLVKLTSESQRPSRVNFGVSGFGSWNFVTGTAVPIRIMNNAFRLAIQALAIQGRARGNKLLLSLGGELEKFAGLDTEVLGEHEFTFSDKLDLDADLVRFDGKICTTSEVLGLIERRFRRDLKDLEVAFTNPNNPNGPKRDGFEEAKQKLNNWRAEQLSFAKPDNINILLTTIATINDLDVEIDLKIVSFDLDVVDRSDLSVNVVLSFDPTLTTQQCFVYCPDHLNGTLIELLESLGIISVDKLLEGKIEDFLVDTNINTSRGHSTVLGEIAKYLGEVLTRTARGFDTFVSAKRNLGMLEVKSLNRPVKGQGGMPNPGPQKTPGTQSGKVGSAAGAVVVEGGGPLVVDPNADPVPNTIGVLPTPDVFKVGSAQSLTRLDRIQRIIVVMMENRSFDHYLGYLHASRPEVDGQTGAVNHVTLNSGQEVRVAGRRAIEIFARPGVPTDRGTTGPGLGPDHHHKPVMEQIAKGAMSGFAQSFVQFSPQNQQAAMCFYDSDSLTAYHSFANEFMICNRWFAAHPGSTFPNRWATLTGTIPNLTGTLKDLDNLAFVDPRLGFLSGNLIFESLDSIGVPWKIYESNYSSARMFERFRLNDSNIVSINDRRDGLDADIRNGRVPEVLFIEPTFTGLPPVSIAEDDQPPTNISRGQEFVSNIYNKLRGARLLRDSLFVVTYDEHGGFYDHVPPPGTELAPAGEKIAKLHPKGPEHLGVRVPSFLISGYVQAGSVFDGILDHTCIIKTILLKYRRKLSNNDFVRYGQRVMDSRHLGEALNLDNPRSSFPVVEARKSSITMRFGSMLPREKDDFAAGLAHSMMPRKR